MLKKAIGEVYLPSAKNILETLMAKAVEWSEHPMLAHTHGQPATPTTLGK
jgi:adenylosuccinate lyase